MTTKSPAKDKIKNPYLQFDNQTLDLDTHLFFFKSGNDCRAYEFLGAHHGSDEDGTLGVIFRTWAPNALGVAVVGDFNNWNAEKNPLEQVADGIWQGFVPALERYTNYKFAVTGSDKKVREKCDPYAFHAEKRPQNASKIYDLTGYEWHDADWQTAKNQKDPYNAPLNIYELHLGSWRRGEGEEGGRFLSYQETADFLIPYVKEMGYTHIELMPVMEHPLDDSWGYQVTGYFAATSRFGTPHDFMGFVDRCHRAGIGVILDWVPAHFPKDGHGLIEFDGTPCYEYKEPNKREHPDWGTRIFDYGRTEVQSFLMSSAFFWLEKFHADGLRVDAVASMLYLDYGKQGSGAPVNKFGGNHNLEAVEFLQKVNKQIFKDFPKTLMIAEESTDWSKVTGPVHEGGLGFNFKWNMGWMNDTLGYVKLDPIARQHNHNQMTFAMSYAFAENYVLPLSHDEVVHGKCSIVEKMPGYDIDKFASARAYLAYQLAHTGKKMTFMGMEFGQRIEWNFHYSLDWHLLDEENPANRQFRDFVKAANHLYLQHPGFWDQDTGWEGFQWVEANDAKGNCYLFRRIAKGGKEVLCLFNFSPIERKGYHVGVPIYGEYRELLNSNAAEWGGWGDVNPPVIKATNQPCHQLPYTISVDLPPYGAVFIELAKELKPPKSANIAGQDEKYSVAGGQTKSGEVALFGRERRDVLSSDRPARLAGDNQTGGNPAPAPVVPKPAPVAPEKPALTVEVTPKPQLVATPPEPQKSAHKHKKHKKKHK